MNVPDLSSPGSPVSLETQATFPPPRRPKLPALLLPPALLSAWAVTAIWVLPQLILLVINLGVWDLVKGEVNADEKAILHQLFGLELFSLIGGVSLCAWLWWSGTKLTRLMGLVLLILPTVFLLPTFFRAQQGIPDAVAAWMLPVGPWQLKQFALTMPAILFGGLRLLCPDHEGDHRPVRGLGMAFLGSVALVAGSYGYLFLAAPLASTALSGAISAVAMMMSAGFFILSCLAAASILRLGISLYINARRSSPIMLGLLTALVALAAPLGGLWLNSLIPFPSNFQIPLIYAATVINGVVLLLPNFANPTLHRIIWLAQCLLFPFSVYFFAIFLPFLPLSPFALIIFGAGLLMYVPSLLVLLHGYRIYDGYRSEIRDGSKLLPLALGIVAILIWPIAYTVQARLDRAALNSALDHLRYPNYAADIRYDFPRPVLRSALTHLQDFKSGTYMPFLSEYYNWLAFDNMVLPQKQIDEMVTTFLDEPLPSPTATRVLDAFPWNGRAGARNVTEMLNEPMGERPTSLATITSSHITHVTEGGMTRTNIILEVNNSSNATTEFHADISIPPGAMISNMWLTIGTERVPGRIFEKKAATWVYQKITEVRPVPQDPAILRYTGPESAELRVYPVEQSAPRIVEVEFLYPADAGLALSLADITIPQPTSGVGQPSLATTDEGGFSVTIPRGTLTAPPILRQPYLHLLVDVSKDSAFAHAATLKDAARHLQTTFPNAQQARLTFVNYETRHFRETLPIEQLLAMPDADLQKAIGPARGGFLPALGLKNIIWRHHLALEDTSAQTYHSFPLIVVLADSAKSIAIKKDDLLAEFARYLPDQPGYWTMIPGTNQKLAFVPLASSIGSETSQPTIRPINILQVGKTRFAVPAGQTVNYTSIGQPGLAPTAIEAYSPDAAKFQPITTPIDRLTAPAYIAGLQPWSLELERIYQPYKHKKGDLDRLLSICRQTGVLVPSAAYMVVENSAQWKMLERTEAKTKNAHESLSLSENSAATPEPSTIALLLIGGGVIALHLWRKRREKLAGS